MHRRDFLRTAAALPPTADPSPMSDAGPYADWQRARPLRTATLVSPVGDGRTDEPGV